MLYCIFCRIVAGQERSYTFWEDDKHIAFLSIFPNTQGVTVVIPKKRCPSYAFDLPDRVLSELIIAAKKVAKYLDESLQDVGRTAMVLEGFGVDHVHAKLFPMHGTADVGGWKPINSNVDKFFNTYEGYISSHDFKNIEPDELDSIFQQLQRK